MGIYRGPNIVTDGLVFGYDADDRSSRFYKGEPTTNLSTTSEAFINGTSSNLNGTWQYGAVTLNNNSVVTEDLKFNNAYQFTFHDATTGNWDMYRRFDSILSGTVYTISMYVKLGTATNFCIIVNNTNAWNTITGKCFTVSDGLNTSTYTRVSITFTGASTNAVNIHLGRHYETVVTQQTNGTVFITGLQMEQKTHATQYLRNTSTSTSVTRSYNQSLIDLKRTTPIDLTNVSFDTTAHPTFDGTDDRIILNDVDLLGGLPSATWEMVLKPGVYTGKHSIWRSGITCWNDPVSGIGLTWVFDLKYRTYYFSLRTNDTGTYPSFNLEGNSSDIHFPDNVYKHYVATYDGTVVKIYINGILIRTANKTGNISYKNANERIQIGVDRVATAPFNGYIPIAKLYNKALSDTEILQNYNAYKKRFNI